MARLARSHTGSQPFSLYLFLSLSFSFYFVRVLFLQPENIVIRSYSRCEVKLIDFGSSCFATDHPTTYIQSRSYRAPEVILGLDYDGRIDVWSLGCVIAEQLTG